MTSVINGPVGAAASSLTSYPGDVGSVPGSSMQAV